MKKNKWPWDKVYVLNLDSEKNRMKIIDNELKKLNIEYTRISATNGFEKFQYGREIKKAETLFEKWNLIEKMNQVLIKQKITDKNISNIKYLKPGQYGHLDSFKRIFEDIIINNYNTVLVLEDDCQFTDDFKNKFFNTYNNLPKNWDLVYLGVNDIHRKVSREPKMLRPHVYNINPVYPSLKGKNNSKFGVIFGTHALLLNKKTAEQWIKYAYPIKWPSDWVMGKLIFLYKKINAYSTGNNIINAYSDYKMNSNTNLI